MKEKIQQGKRGGGGREEREITNSTLHLAVDPRLQPKQSFSRCNRQMVIEFMFAG